MNNKKIKKMKEMNKKNIKKNRGARWFPHTVPPPQGEKRRNRLPVTFVRLNWLVRRGGDGRGEQPSMAWFIERQAAYQSI